MIARAELKRAATALVSTSVDDCRASLAHCDNIRVLVLALAMSIELGHRSRVIIIGRRINQLTRKAA